MENKRSFSKSKPLFQCLQIDFEQLQKLLHTSQSFLHCNRNDNAVKVAEWKRAILMLHGEIPNHSITRL